MKGKHAQTKLSTVGAMPPNPLSLKTRGGGGIQGPGLAAPGDTHPCSQLSAPLGAPSLVNVPGRENRRMLRTTAVGQGLSRHHV